MSECSSPVCFDFYFGVGSRYSYLLATQADTLETAGAVLDWCPLYSPELIRRVGPDPFAPQVQRGQYAWEYRRADAARWAAHYGVPYHDPGTDKVDWRQIARWAVGARMQGCGRAFGLWALERTFAEGNIPVHEDELVEGALTLGLDPAIIADAIATGQVDTHHAALVERAHAQGAFGVPTLVADDGALFWGQDRLPLVIDYLRDRHGR